MSTNYSWYIPEPEIELPTGERITYYFERDDPRVHIGKASHTFVWAQDPQVVRAACQAHLDDWVVVDEYGRPYTGREFLRLLDDYQNNEVRDYIGRRFS